MTHPWRIQKPKLKPLSSAHILQAQGGKLRRLEKTLQENPAFYPWARCKCCWMLLPVILPCWHSTGTEHVRVHQ